MARQIVLAILGALPGLAFAVVIFFLARLLIRIARAFFDRVEHGSLSLTWLDRDTARPTRRIFAFVVWVFALAMAYPYLPGAQTEAFKGLSVLVGLMVSLGGASVIGQAFSGLILMYSRPFRRGDYVRIGDNEGTVTELGMFTTRIRTGLGEEITLPNSRVIAATIEELLARGAGTGYVLDTLGDHRLRHALAAGRGHAAGGGAAHRRTSRETPSRSCARPRSRTSTSSTGWSPTAGASARARAEVLPACTANIQDVFNEHGVQIMSPHYMMDPPEPQVVPKEKWFTPPAKSSSAYLNPEPSKTDGRRSA